MAWWAAGADATKAMRDIQTPLTKQLDKLAARHSLHPLHVEDCRKNAQRTKLEISEGYLFIFC